MDPRAKGQKGKQTLYPSLIQGRNRKLNNLTHESFKTQITIVSDEEYT